MTRKDAQAVIRSLLIENGNKVDKDVIRVALNHGISLGSVNAMSRKLQKEAA